MWIELMVIEFFMAVIIVAFIFCIGVLFVWVKALENDLKMLGHDRDLLERYINRVNMKVENMRGYTDE